MGLSECDFDKMTVLTLDECLLLECAEEYDNPLWEAAWIFSSDKKERGERALRILFENGLVVLSRTKSWEEEIITPLTAIEQQSIFERLHEQEDWEPPQEPGKSFISFYITPKGKTLLHNDEEVRGLLIAHSKVRGARKGNDRWSID
jgi:hypothetical protein